MAVAQTHRRWREVTQVALAVEVLAGAQHGSPRLKFTGVEQVSQMGNKTLSRANKVHQQTCGHQSLQHWPERIDAPIWIAVAKGKIRSTGTRNEVTNTSSIQDQKAISNSKWDDEDIQELLTKEFKKIAVKLSKNTKKQIYEFKEFKVFVTQQISALKQN